MTDHKEPGVVTEQLELVELYLSTAETAVKDAQERSLFRPCRRKTLSGCILCRIKRYILRKRYK